MRRALVALAATACMVLAGGCGDDEPDADGSSGSPAATPTPSESTSAATTASPTDSSPSASEPSSPPASVDEGQVIEITFDGDSVTPNGDRVKVKAGEPIEFRVTADAPGEIHVHSNPEQELEYDEGSTTLTLTIDQPGIVEVESHSLDKVIVQLEVSP